MCTTIGNNVEVDGSAKGPRGWIGVDQVHVGYDHPTHVPLEHALSLDFVRAGSVPGERVAVELSREDARRLAVTILQTVDEADAYEVRS